MDLGNPRARKNVAMELSEEAKKLKPGIYKHFKGGMYRVLHVARDSEDRERELVVYQSLDRGGVWVRPLKMFIEEVERDGYKGPRFAFVEPA